MQGGLTSPQRVGVPKTMKKEGLGKEGERIMGGEGFGKAKISKQKDFISGDGSRFEGTANATRRGIMGGQRNIDGNY